MSSHVAGRYQLIREIGSGAMGRVFQAVDTETGESVAAKVLIAGSEIDLQALLRFQQEGTVLATLKHPHIVQVHGTYLEDGMSSIIMELLDGRSLGQIMRAEALSLARTRHLTQQVASALAYAHSRGIIHRDVKPDNIMVVGEDHVKVTDFGIARVLQDGIPFGTLTGTGATLGTPWYMSPEQIEGARVDGRSDIYSFGAVLYQMVAGKPPFEGSDPVTVAFQHVHKAAQPPGIFNPDLPQDWEELILTCLAKNPDHRYQTAVALGEALAALETIGHVVPRRSEAESEHGAPDGAEAAAHDQEARVLMERAKSKELTGDFSGAWRDYRAALTVASPGPLRDELNKSVDLVGARMAAPAEVAVPRPQPGTSAATDTSDRSTRRAGRTPSGTARRVAVPPVRSRLAGLFGGIGILVVAGAIALVLIHSLSSGSTAASDIKLAISGRHHGNLYNSGQTVSLHWTSIPGADVYRLEAATRATDPSDATVFKRPLLSELTTATSHAIHVIGRQFYYWRVQAEVQGVWGPYSRSMHFLVNSPSIPAPFPLSPPDSASLTVTQVHLCWSPVRGAAEYDLSVDSAHVTNPQMSTCAWVRVQPGNYRWRVAARVLGVRLYTGARSQPAFFTINVRPTPAAQPLPATSVPPTTTPIAQPTTAPRQAPKQKHTATASSPRSTRPTPAPPTASPTPRPTSQALSFRFNRLVATFPGGRASKAFAVNQQFVVLLAFTVRNLATNRVVQARMVRDRKLYVPGKGLRLVRASSVSIAAHRGRNTLSYTTSVGRSGTFRIVVSITIRGQTRVRYYDLQVR